MSAIVVGAPDAALIRKNLTAVQEHRRPAVFPPDDYYSHMDNDRVFFIVADWMLGVALEYGMRKETAFRAVEIAFQYFKRAACTRVRLQLYGGAALLIANQLEEEKLIMMSEIVDFTADTYTDDEVFNAELDILRALDFDLAFPTAYQLALAALAESPVKATARTRAAVRFWLFICVARSGLYAAFPASALADAAIAMGHIATGARGAEVMQMLKHPRSVWGAVAHRALDCRAWCTSDRTLAGTMFDRQWRAHAGLEREFASDLPPLNAWPIVGPTSQQQKQTALDVWAVYREIRLINQDPRGRITSSFGKVYEAVRRSDGLRVAVKEALDGSKDPKYGFEPDVMIEVSLLKLLPPHPNLLTFLEVVATPTTAHTVFEYMDMDLEHYVKMLVPGPRWSPRPLGADAVAPLFKQIVKGVAHIHAYGRIHRDLKPQNILVKLTTPPTVKVADFWMAEVAPLYSKRGTLGQTTVGYSSPEYLLGSEECDTGIDVWALGCILGGLLKGRMLFDGGDEYEVWEDIVHTLGSPTEALWPGVTAMPNWDEDEPTFAPVDLTSYFVTTDTKAVGCVLSMLQLNPASRVDVAQLLRDPYIADDEPAPPEGAVVGTRGQSVVKTMAKRMQLRLDSLF